MNRDHKPRLEQIAGLLESIQAEPSDDFRKRMESAPWHTTQVNEMPTKGAQSLMLNQRVLLNRLRMPLSIAAALLLLTALILIVPPLRTMAQDVLQLFTRASNDAIVLENPGPVDSSEPTAEPPSEFANALPVEQVEAQAGFDVLVPSALPAGYTLKGAIYHASLRQVTLVFNSPLGRGLTIEQSDVSNGLPTDGEWSQIGVSAPVRMESVRGTIGEYVAGAWGVYPGSNVREWIAEAPMRRLRWQEGNLLITIHAMGGSEDSPDSVTQAGILTIAESLQ